MSPSLSLYAKDEVRETTATSENCERIAMMSFATPSPKYRKLLSALRSLKGSTATEGIVPDTAGEVAVRGWYSASHAATMATMAAGTPSAHQAKPGLRLCKARRRGAPSIRT